MWNCSQDLSLKVGSCYLYSSPAKRLALVGLKLCFFRNCHPSIIPISPREALQHALHCHSRQPSRHPQGDQRASRLRRDHYDARRSPMHRGTTPGSLATASASSRSSRLTIRRSPGVPQLAVGRSPVPAGPAAGLLTSSPSWPAWLSLRSCDWQDKGARLTIARGRGPGTLALNPCPKLLTSSLNSLHAHMTFIAFNLQL